MAVLTHLALGIAIYHAMLDCQVITLLLSHQAETEKLRKMIMDCFFQWNP